jgi:glycine/D-amino acid oxidase-like deaminating enzyme
MTVTPEKTATAENLTLKPDVLIIGGGVAGLWLINHLQQKGYECLLLEKGSLGGGQTLASQGIIHGGLKYALTGTLSGESEAISAMPGRWREALAGRGSVDLAGLPLLSETQYLWSAGSMASRMTTFFASKMLRGRIDKLERTEFPQALANPAFKGSVYRLEDLVIDTERLVKHLAAKAAGRLLIFDPARDRLEWDERGLAAATVAGRRIEPGVTVFSAGEGNQTLLTQAHKQGLLLTEEVQLRPLKMLLVKHALGEPFYGHCIGASNKPQLTVTTHKLSDTECVWYLGGDLAEKGVDLSDKEQIAAGVALLKQLFPWLDFSGSRFATLDVNRAEPYQPLLVKPDSAYAKRERQLVVAWPTKLTLAPDLADRVTALLDPPAEECRSLPELLPELPQAGCGISRWHSCGWVSP